MYNNYEVQFMQNLCENSVLLSILSEFVLRFAIVTLKLPGKKTEGLRVQLDFAHKYEIAKFSVQCFKHK